MRRLIHVPIVHTAADLGSLSESLRERYLKRFGRSGWKHREQAVAELWTGIREDLGRLRLDFNTVAIYQDGLPVCGFEEKIVTELAEAGSLNHQLVLDLMAKGATLVGTEDPQLLIREYEMQTEQTPEQFGSETAHAEHLQQARLVLEARDRFIVKRIQETLSAGETGVLFLGAAHQLDGLRSADLLVETLGGKQ